MNIFKRMRQSVCGLMVVALLVAAAPQAAEAQTYQYTRAQLIAQIQQLLAEIARLDNRQFYYYQPTYSYQYQYRPGQVLGASNSTTRVEVETLKAIDVEDDEAAVYGNVDLNGQAYATVWFEYGEDDDDLDEQSRSGRIDRNDRSTFRADLEDLDEDEKYYYRAVARGANGYTDYGAIRSFETDRDGRSSRNDDDEPEVETGDADDVDEDSAEINGEVDMNDFSNGRVFFVFGEDEDQVEDIADEYDEYRDIDEDGDDLQVVLVDNDLDDDARYSADIWGLDDDTEIYFSICVEFEDEDDDATIICGDVESFETDRD